MNRSKRFVVGILVFFMCTVVISTNKVSATRNVRLSNKIIKVTKDKSDNLTIKNVKGNVNWKIVSGKKNIKIAPKGRKSITVIGKKEGVSTIRAIVGKKKLICKVIVEKKEKKTASENVLPVQNYCPEATPHVTYFPGILPKESNVPISIMNPPSSEEPASKDANDMYQLEEIIQEQKELGATVNENLDSEQYRWDAEGNLTGINWNNTGIQGEICFSEFLNLTSLSCANNQIEKLDISSNRNLEYLNCSGNPLTELQFYLSEIYRCNLTYLDCSFTLIKWLDISDLIDLKYLDCSDSLINSIYSEESYKLEYLDCSNNLLASNLGYIGSFINIKILDCSSNSIDYIPLANYKQLTHLYCDNNNISSLNLSESTKLRFLSCTENSITELDLLNCPLLNYAYYDEDVLVSGVDDES